MRPSYRTVVSLEAGLSATRRHVVTHDHTALAHGSGDVAVLATPRVLAWCEEATMDAIAPVMVAEEAAVGMRVRMDHIRATPVGADVEVLATLTRVEGRRLTFDITASDDRGKIATGQVIRVIVDRERFMERATEPNL
jgi:fluoroacetyl-CoA thioesterase